MSSNKLPFNVARQSLYKTPRLDDAEQIKATYPALCPLATDRVRLNIAFDYLRKMYGFIARQNFSCCGGCASAEIADNPKNHNIPMITYHRQETDRMWHEHYAETLAPSGACLGYGVVENSDLASATGPVQSPARELDVLVGKCIAQVMKAVGFDVEWNGSADEKIIITSVYLKTEEARKLAERERDAMYRNISLTQRMAVSVEAACTDIFKYAPRIGLTDADAETLNKVVSDLLAKMAAHQADLEAKTGALFGK